MWVGVPPRAPGGILNSELVVDYLLYRDALDQAWYTNDTNGYLSRILSEEMHCKVVVHEATFDPRDFRFHVTKASINKGGIMAKPVLESIVKVLVGVVLLSLSAAGILPDPMLYVGVALIGVGGIELPFRI